MKLGRLSLLLIKWVDKKTGKISKKENRVFDYEYTFTDS